MGITKKTLLLSDANFDHKSMATLLLERKGKETICVLKTFYLEDKTSDYLLGIACNDKQVTKQKIQFYGNNSCTFRVSDPIDLESKITCVMVTEDKKTPVIWGSTEKLDDTRYQVVKNLEKESEKQKSSTMVLSTPVIPIEEVKSEKIEGAALFEELEDEELNGLISATIEKEEVENIFESEMQKLGETSSIFYEQIKDQIEDIFEHGVHEENLERLIVGSKWVIVDGVDGGEDYILGLLYAGNDLEYIAYGIKGEKNIMPPQEFRAFSQFIPTNLEDNEGYWVMYQDAVSGDNCKLADDVA